MPRFLRKEPGGEFPKKFNQVNLIPEQQFVREGLEIWMRCKETVTTKKPEEQYDVVQLSGDIESSYREPSKCPYFLETRVSVDDGQDPVDKVIGAMETITDVLTFQLQYPVKIVHLETHSPSQSVPNEFDIVVYSGTPYYRIVKDAVAVFNDQGYLGFDPYWIQCDMEEDVAAALRWFAKGLAADPVIDKYTFYWIAFETLATKWPGIETKNSLECPRCRKTIIKCPICNQNTEVGPRIAERIRRVGRILKRNDDLIDSLYSTRHLVHGTMQLKNQRDIEKLPELTQQLKALAVDAIKARLGMPSSEPPLANPLVAITWSSMRVKGTTKELTW
jgi:hypothetical protein